MYWFLDGPEETNNYYLMNKKIIILYAFNAKPSVAYIQTRDVCPATGSEDFQFSGYNHLLQLSKVL